MIFGEDGPYLTIRESTQVTKSLSKTVKTTKKEEDANVSRTYYTTRNPCGHHVKRIVHFCNKGV